MGKKLKWRKAAAAAAILIATVLAGLFPRLLYGPDKALSDALCQKPSVTNKKIFIIAIDDKTLKNYGAITSWSRDIPAKLVERLNSGESRPAVIGFDVIYSEKGSGDAGFAQVCREAGNVVNAMSFRFREMPEKDEKGRTVYNPFHVDYAVTPYEELADAAALGFTNTFLDSDGYVRRALPCISYEGGTVYSLAGEIYRKYQESQGREAVLPEGDRNGLFYFSYSGETGCYSTVSMADVLDGSVDVRLFSDAIVLVGAYAAGMQDAYMPAISRNSQMFGVEIQANIVEALLEGRTQTDLPRIPYAVCVGVLSVLFFLLIRRVRILTATAALFVFGAADLLFVKAAYAAGYVAPAALPLLSAFLIFACNLIYGYIMETLRRKRVVHIFKKYVAPQVVDEISRKKDFEISLGGENRNIAVLFVDIRGFTALSESLSPETVVGILNEYHALTTRAILDNGGMLDKFVGDAAMAVFNAPFDLDDYIYRAVRTARDMQAGAEAVAKSCMSRFGRSVSFGIGINCGEAVVGNIGCEFRMDYTAIGDTVNTAARLESNAQSGQILISRQVYEAVRDRITVTPVGEIPLKGKEKSVFVYQLDEVR